MVKRQLQRISLGSLFFIIGAISIFAQPKTMVSGKVISKEKQEVVDFATVYLKGTTYGCTTNEEGIYHLHAPAGKYTLVVSAIGYKTIEKPVTLVHGERIIDSTRCIDRSPSSISTPANWLPTPGIMERILPIPPIFLICCIWFKKSL